MTDIEKAIVMANTGITMLAGDKFQIFHKYIEKILGRPVWTHELGDELVWNEIKEKSKDDFLEICKREDGWIPVSERLPMIDAENGWKASDVVLVSLADETIHMGFYCEDKKWRFCESGEAKEPFWKDIIAWQPLPEPCKEAENE